MSKIDSIILELSTHYHILKRSDRSFQVIIFHKPYLYHRDKILMQYPDLELSEIGDSVGQPAFTVVFNLKD